MKALVQEWLLLHQKGTATFEVMINAWNESTYFSTDAMHASFGSTLAPARLQQVAKGRIESLHADLKTNLEEMRARLFDLIKERNEMNTDETQIDGNFLNEIVEQLQQQTMLESNIIEGVSRKVEEGRSIQSDEAVTMLSCFTYSPYLKEESLKEFAALDV
jgi:hypothetical protein